MGDSGNATNPARKQNRACYSPAVNVDRAPCATGDEGLVRVIGLRSAILFVVGSVIGSGIFLTTGGMAAVIPSASLLLAAWILGGVLAIAGGLTYAEMGAMFPRSGGVYVFLKEAYGPLTAFLYGWAALFVVISGGIAAVAVGFAEYLSYFLPALSRRCPCLGGLVVGGQSSSRHRSFSSSAPSTTRRSQRQHGQRLSPAAKVGALASLPVMALIAARVDAGLRADRAARPRAACRVVWRRHDRSALDVRSVVFRHVRRR